MEKFTEKTFNIGELVGIGAKNIEEHLKLYKGYVTNTNSVIEKISSLSQGFFRDGEDNGYLIAELFRRFSFEYNGMRNHEVYFSSLSGGARALNPESDLAKQITKECMSLEIFLMGFKNMALTRGVGWAVLWYDKKDKRLIASWVDEQHIGQLNGCEMILALDMWEHAYVYDYATSEKKKYIDAFFANLNWSVIEENFKNAQ
ncbi:MAG: superoxide dismutase [Candidatus Pacebacteria bacterium]|nr:superoxide dismutase [Candidatus Paceibacterota bacterium]MBP9716127.1 superoxide dismutase [Candidatus Paceibacterota bacterium]